MQRPVSRRPCRQPVRPAALKEARETTRTRRDQRRRLTSGRGTRHRRRDPQAGGGRPLCDRRRVSARPGITIFSNSSTTSSSTSASARSSSPAAARSRGRSCLRRHRQARRLQAAPDDRAFQISKGSHPANRQGDDPVAVVVALPLWPRCRAGIDLSVDGRLLPRPRRELSQGGARVRRRRLPLSAARRGQSRIFVRSIVPRAHHARAATIRRRCPRSMPT